MISPRPAAAFRRRIALTGAHVPFPRQPVKRYLHGPAGDSALGLLLELAKELAARVVGRQANNVVMHDDKAGYSRSRSRRGLFL